MLNRFPKAKASLRQDIICIWTGLHTIGGTTDVDSVPVG